MLGRRARIGSGWLACAALGGFLAAFSQSSTAQAYDAEVDASFDAQFYTLRSPFGDPLVRRRRYTQTLGLGVYNLQGDFVPYGPQLSFKARVRLDGDFGQENAERDPRNNGRYVPGLEQAPVDLMYGYLEGRNYFGGFFGFQLGRQYVVDSLGWWSFDGGLVRLTTPAFFQVEAYGGFEQRGGLPLLSTNRYTADGVYRGDREDLEFNQYPSYLEESKLAPAYGFALESSGVHWAHGRFSYRKVINRDTVYISPFGDAGNGFSRVSGDRISSEKLGYSMRLSDQGLGALKGEFVYDLYNQVFSEHEASIDWYTTDQINLGAGYEYYFPTFDGDSIWNWFSHNGMTTYLGRASFFPTRRIDIAVSGGVRQYKTDADPSSYESQASSGIAPEQEATRVNDVLGNLGGGYRWSDGSVRLSSLLETGESGHRVGGDITTRKEFEGGLYDALLIVSLFDWEDAIRPGRDATSFSYVLGGGISPFERTRLGAEFEHSMNRLVGQRYRMLATLEVAVLP